MNGSHNALWWRSVLSSRSRAGLLLACLAGAFATALGAQGLLRNHGDSGGGLVLLAFVLAVIAGRLLVAQPAPAPPHPPLLRPLRPGWLVTGITALALALTLQHLGRAPVAELVLLQLSLCAWIVAYVPTDFALRDQPRWLLAARVALLALSLLSCLYALDHIPGGLYGDEAVTGIAVRAHLHGARTASDSSGIWTVPWMQSASVLLAGEGVGGLRLTAAIGGALCVLPWFALLRRELGVVAAAGSTLLLCASPAHQHISRLAQGEAWIGVCAFTAMAGLYAGLVTGRAAAYVASGVALGGAFYMGSKALLLPPMMLGSALCLIVATGKSSLSQWRGAVLLSMAAVLTYLPQLLAFTSRSWHETMVGHASGWMNTPYPGGPFQHCVAVARLLLDGVEQSPFSPFKAPFHVVTEVEGALMVVGLGLAVARARRPIVALLLGWLVAGLGCLLLDGRPNQFHHVLLVSCLPAAFAALALHAWQHAVTSLSGRPAVGAWLALVCAAALVVANGAAYFGRGAGAAPWAAEEFTALGKAMQEHRDTHHVALITVPMSWDQNSVLLYLAPGFVAPTKLTTLDPQKPWFESVERDVAFLVMGRSASLLPAIRERYPLAPVELRKSAAGDLLLAVVRVPSSEVRRAEAQLRNR